MTILINWIVFAIGTMCSELYAKSEEEKDEETTDVSEGEPERDLPENRLTILVRGIIWPRTFFLWFVHGKLDQLLRFGVYVWTINILDWLVLWIADQIDQNWLLAGWIFLVSVYAVLYLVTVCIHHLPWERGTLSHRQILIHDLFWIPTVVRWFKGGELKTIAAFSATIWVLLTMCWESGSNDDVYHRTISFPWLLP